MCSVSQCSQLIVSSKTYLQIRILTNTFQILYYIIIQTLIHGSWKKFRYALTGHFPHPYRDDLELVMLHSKSVEQRNQNNLSNLWAFSLPCLFAWSAFDLTQNMISFPCSYNAIQQLRNKRNIQTKKTSGIKSEIW